MDYIIESQPDHDFTYRQLLGHELLGKNSFTNEISFLKCTQGEATISLNAMVHTFKKDSCFLLLDAMFFKVTTCTNNFQMEQFAFSIRYFNEVYSSIDNKTYDLLQYCAPDIASTEAMKMMNLTLDNLKQSALQPANPYHQKIALHLVLCFVYQQAQLISLHRESHVINSSNYAAALIDKFFILCHAEHLQHRQVEYYAEQLNISVRYLQKIIKEAMNSSPKQIIDYYITGSAKRLLLTTALSNQQIADQLNFPDQTTFGQFFKRNTGMPPSDFRRLYS